MGTVKEHVQRIDGKLYKCKTFPASDGLRLLPRIISLLGEEVANLVFSVDDDGMSVLMGDGKVRAAIMVKIAERAEENDGLLVLRDLMKYTTFVREHEEKGAPAPVEVPTPLLDIFDEHFAGDYLHLLNVAMWVGRASFGNP